jgi:hypothetical protein
VGSVNVTGHYHRSAHWLDVTRGLSG